MTQLDILLPFALPSAEMAPDLMRELNTPALAKLISRTQSFTQESFDGFSRALPHEAWLARQFGLAERSPTGGSPALATALMNALGLTPAAGTWFILHPVHIHIARDHLVLTDMRQLTLPEPESRALFETAQPLFEEAGKALMYGNAQTWFARADDWADLETSTPDAACGHNIDIWMPKGSAARDWRRLQNEVQMHWHTHPVNAEREARRDKVVNSLWLWGGAPTAMAFTSEHYHEVFNLSGWMRAFRQFAFRQMQECSAADIVALAPDSGLLILDSLIEPALAGDWSLWLQRFHALEADWFAPLTAAVKAGKLNQISLILTHNSGVSSFTTSRNSLRKFWTKPALTRLLS